MMLSVRNIETWYGPVNAIKGVSIDVASGRIVAVLGANGAGKTTLLKTIAGVVDPFKGSVSFEGSRDRWPRSRRRLRGAVLCWYRRGGSSFRFSKSMKIF